MTDYTKLVRKLRDLHRDPRPASAVWLFDNQVALYDAAAAIEDLEARLGEAENSVENYKRMWPERHEPKVGRWIEHGLDEGFLVERYTCSNCDYYSGTKKTNFCPNCGAVMEDMCEVHDV